MKSTNSPRPVLDHYPTLNCPWDGAIFLEEVFVSDTHHVSTVTSLSHRTLSYVVIYVSINPPGLSVDSRRVYRTEIAEIIWMEV